MPVATRFQNGRSVRLDPFKDIGDTGLNAWGGYISEDILRIAGSDWSTLTKRVQNIEEMLLNSPILGGALRLSIEMPISNIDWTWTSEEGEEDPRLELLNDSWDAMSHSWRDHIKEALLFAFYGFSFFTIQYQRDGSRILWKKFKLLGHDSIQNWVFAEDGGLDGVQQYPHLWPEPIPIEKSILYRFRRTKNNPEGESVLRPAWVPYYYAKNMQDIEAIGIERNLAGLPIVLLSEDADPEDGSDDMNKAEQIVRNIRNDEQAGITVPNGWEVKLLSSGGLSKTIDTNLVIARYEKRMLAAALSQFIMLGMDNVGALATFEGATDFHAMLVDSMATVIADAQTSFAMPRLMALNGLSPDGIKLEHSPAGSIDMEKFANALAQVGDLLTLTPDDENIIRSILNFDTREPEEIQALQEERQARAAEAAERVRQQLQQQQQPSSNGQEEEQMHADLYAAGNAPDDGQRRKFERQWERKMVNFWNGAMGRIKRESKKIA